MILILVSSFFVCLNIVLWIFFLSKIKTIFSTEEIIKSTRLELEQMISDVNRNAGRNIDLIDDRIKQLRTIVAEADRHVSFAQAELDRQKNAMAFQQQINSARPSYQQQSVTERYSKNSRVSHADDVYNLTVEGKRQVQPMQADLFDSLDAENTSSREIVSDNGTKFMVESEGPAFTSVPVITPDVTYAESPIEPKKRFADLVHDLYTVGHSVEEIARELNKSTTEVQMVLDIGF